MALRIRENKNSPVVAQYQSLRDEEMSFAQLLARLEAPSARILEVTALVLVELAKRGPIDLPSVDLSLDSLRRIGFVADRVAETQELGSPVRRRLKRFAAELYEELPQADFDDLGFSRSTSAGRIRRLKTQADEIDLRWRVWGRVELRREFLR